MLTQTLEQMDGKSEQNCMKPETHTHKTALLFIFCQGEILQPYALSGSSLMTFLFKAPPWQVTSAEACASSAWTPLRVWSPLADFVVSLAQRSLRLRFSVNWPLWDSAPGGGKSVHLLVRVRCDGHS